MKRTIGCLIFATVFALAILAGCNKHKNGATGVPDNDNGDVMSRMPKLSNSEVERRLNDYFIDLDAAANLQEFYTAISRELQIPIEIKTDRVSPDTPINLKNSKDSIVGQILEYVCSATGTRFEIKRGRIWIKNAY